MVRATAPNESGVTARGRVGRCAPGRKRASGAGPPAARRVRPGPLAPRRRAGHRGGYTLLELLLVLAVLAVFVGMMWPVAHRTYANQRFQKAVDEVRVRLAGTRFKAIDASAIYQFRYEPGGRRFLVIPLEPELPVAASRGPDPAASLEDARPRFSGELAEGFWFDAPDGPATVEPLGPEWLDGLPDALELSQVRWAAPLIFYPDGSAEDGAVDVYDAPLRSVRLFVRGLTGAVTVSRPRVESMR